VTEDGDGDKDHWQAQAGEPDRSSCASSTSCTVVSPAHEAGTVDVIATVSKVKSPTSAGDLFTYS
jgi:hypothetical protein